MNHDHNSIILLKLDSIVIKLCHREQGNDLKITFVIIRVTRTNRPFRENRLLLFLFLSDVKYFRLIRNYDFNHNTVQIEH